MGQTSPFSWLFTGKIHVEVVFLSNVESELGFLFGAIKGQLGQ